MIPAWEVIAFAAFLAALGTWLAATGCLSRTLRRGQARPRQQTGEPR